MCRKFCEKIHVGIPGFAVWISFMQCVCAYVGRFQIPEADEYK